MFVYKNFLFQILVSTDCLISLTMGSNTTDRNILTRIIDKSRNARCSPKVIKPIMKRIAPAWSLKDLYETDYRTAAKAQSDKSVEPLTGYKQLTSRKIEMLLYTPYTQLTTTESTMETFSEETSTQSMKRELVFLKIDPLYMLVIFYLIFALCLKITFYLDFILNMITKY